MNSFPGPRMSSCSFALLPLGTGSRFSVEVKRSKNAHRCKVVVQLESPHLSSTLQLSVSKLPPETVSNWSSMKWPQVHQQWMALLSSILLASEEYIRWQATTKSSSVVSPERSKKSRG